MGEISTRTYRLALFVAGRTGLTSQVGPRKVLKSQVLSYGVQRLFGDAWSDVAYARLLKTGALAADGTNNAGLIAPTPLPTSVAEATTADTIVEVISSSETTALYADLYSFTSPAIDLVGELLARGVPMSASSWHVHRPLSSTFFASDLIDSPSNSKTSTPSRSPVSLLSTPTPSSTKSSSTWSAPTGLTYTAPAAHTMTVTSMTVTFTGTPTFALARALTSSDYLAEVYVRDHSDVVVLNPMEAGATITIPAGTLKPGYIYRVDVSARLRATWAFVYDVPTWPLPLFEDTFRRELGERGLATSSFQYNGSDVMTNILATSSKTPLLYVHAPPFGGGLAATPTYGTALTDSFIFSSSGWKEINSDVVSTTPPTDYPASGALLSHAPLPPTLVTGLIIVTLDEGAGGETMRNSLIYSGLSASGVCGSFSYSSSTVSALPTSAPAWFRAQLLVSNVLTLDQASYCTALAENVLYVAGLQALSGNMGAYAALGSFTYAFRVDNAVGAPLPLSISSSSVTSSGVVSLDALSTTDVLVPLTSNSSWPGISIRALASSSTTSIVWLFTPADGNAGYVNIYTIAVDSVGAAGIAITSVLITPALTGTDAKSSSTVTTLASGLISSLVSANTASSNPGLVLITTASLAQILMKANAPASVSDIAAATSVSTSISALIDSVVTTFSADGTSPAGTRIADDALGSVASTLADITLNPALVSTSTIASSLSAIRRGASLATPSTSANMTVSLYAAVASAAALPASAANASLLVISNIISASKLLSTTGTSGTTTSTSASVFDTAASLSVESSAPTASATILNQTLTVIDTLAAAFLRGAKDGSTFSYSSASSRTSNSTCTDVCGCDVALTVSRVTISPSGSTDRTVRLGSALSSCSPSQPVTLPASVISSVPPPSVVIPGASLSSLAFSTGLSTLDVQILQWGYSPRSESAGVSSLTFPTPSSARRATVVATPVSFSRHLFGAPDANEGFGVSSIRTLVDAFDSALPAGGVARHLVELLSTSDTASVPTSTSVAASVYEKTAETSSSAADALPGRGMDSRLTTIKLTSGTSAVSTRTVAAPFIITLPLKDLSLPVYSAVTGSRTGFNVLPGFSPPVVNITCPTSPLSSVNAIYDSPASLAGKSARAFIVNATPVLYSTAYSTSYTTDARYSTSASSANMVNVRDSSRTTEKATQGTLVNSSISAAIVSSYAFWVSVNCAAPASYRNLFCGPGEEGRVVQYTCPALAPTAACLWFDTTAGAWSSSGCTVVRVGDTSVTCSCTHLTDFAARFVALPVEGPNYFASADGIKFSFFTKWTAGIIAVTCTVLALASVGVLVGSVYDSAAGLRFTQLLAADDELVFLQKTRALSEKPFVLDRIYPQVTARADAAEALFKVPSAAAMLAAAVHSMQGYPMVENDPKDALRVAKEAARQASKELDKVAAAIDHGSQDSILSLLGQRYNDHFNRVPATVAGALSAVALAAKAHRKALENRSESGDESDGSGSSEGASSEDSEDEHELARAERVRAKAETVEKAAALSAMQLGLVLRNFAASFILLARIAWQRLPYVHPALSIFTRFDPFFSRPLRILGLVAIIFGHMMFCALFYSWFYGFYGITTLPALTVLNMGVIMIAATAASIPFDMLVWHLLRKAGRVEFNWRYAEFVGELRRREEAEHMLNLLTTPALADGVDAEAALDSAVVSAYDSADNSPRTGGGEVGDYLRAAINHGLLARAEKLAKAGGFNGADGRGNGGSGGDSGDEEESDGTASVESGGSILDTEDEEKEIFIAEATREWTDPPVSMDIVCGSLLWLCGRNSVQRSAYIEFRSTIADREANDAAHYMAAAGALPPRPKPLRVCCGFCWAFRAPLPQAELSRTRRRLKLRSARVAPTGDDLPAHDLFTHHILTADPRSRFDAVGEALLSARLHELDDDTNVELQSWRLFSFDMCTATCCAPTLRGQRVGWNSEAGCTLFTAAVIAAVALYVCFALFVVSAFNIINGEVVTNSMLGAWACSMAWSIFLLQPLSILWWVYSSFFVWPALAEFIAWIPISFDWTGATRAVRIRRDVGAEGLLTTRLEHLVLARAAAGASGVARSSLVAGCVLDHFAIAAVDPTLAPPLPEAERFSPRESLRRALILRKYVLMTIRSSLGLYASVPQAFAAAALLASGASVANTALASATVPFPRIPRKALLLLADNHAEASNDVDFAILPQLLIDTVNIILDSAEDGSPRVYVQSLRGSRRKLKDDSESEADGDGSDDDGALSPSAQSVRSARSARSARSPMRTPRSRALNQSVTALSVAGTPAGNKDDDELDNFVHGHLFHRLPVPAFTLSKRGDSPTSRSSPESAVHTRVSTASTAPDDVTSLVSGVADPTLPRKLSGNISTAILRPDLTTGRSSNSVVDRSVSQRIASPELPGQAQPHGHYNHPPPPLSAFPTRPAPWASPLKVAGLQMTGTGPGSPASPPPTSISQLPLSNGARPMVLTSPPMSALPSSRGGFPSLPNSLLRSRKK